jgi:aminopeptidase N
MKQSRTAIIASSVLMAFAIGLTACSEGEKKEAKTEKNEAEHVLIHSHAQPAESKVTHLSWDADVDFEQKQLRAKATYDLENAEDADRLMLDVRNLNINEVWVDGEKTDKWWLGQGSDYFGQGLEIEIKPTTKQVSIAYTTNPDAQALQWLTPQQTAGKEHPFLFTQSQAILARTWIPIQDSPGIRYTYDAHVTVPSGLMAVMSASNPTEIDSTGEYDFKMEQPIPSYLMALAVGDLRFKAIGDETGVYAEPSMLDASAFEFEDMQKMLESAEEIYGAYAWDRYDVLVLPPSFPFGGMENPRLTFATPTILAGDKSLTALIAHELAHSWSGNLVTNRTWNDFWLNEGFTVYFERRIMEAVYGKDYTAMLQVLGRQDLMSTLAELGEESEDTHLKLDLDNRDPDDGMTDIAYEKGNAFLMMLEEAVGRERFDAFLYRHFEENAFKTTNTEAFVQRIKDDLLEGDAERFEELKINEWVYGPGLPSNAVAVSSDAFSKVEANMEAWLVNDDLSAMDPTGWTTHQWLHFLRNLPDSITTAQMSQLDRAFGFTETGNSELAAEWYVLALEQEYTPADDAIEAFLIEVGRRKFLVPIYTAMVEADPTLARARAVYAQARNNYHSVSVQTLDELLKWDDYDAAS